jgi:hypothetical protein
MTALAPPGSNAPKRPATTRPATQKSYGVPTLLIEVYGGKDVLSTREIPLEAIKLDGTMQILK